MPLTHREHAQSVRFVTAHGQHALAHLDWAALAQERQTLAFYMGVGQLGPLTRGLLAHGRAPGTPFALIENGTRSRQRVVTGELARLPELAAEHQVAAPALLIVGEVAALAPRLGWYGTPVAPGRCTQDEMPRDRGSVPALDEDLMVADACE